MTIKNVLWWSGLLWLLQGCGQTPNITGFNSDRWQGDMQGCRGHRLEQLELIVDQQNELLGWSENEITSYLGEPDYRELYIRNQKFLVYYLEPAEDCGDAGKSNPLRIYLRMDALGDSREVSLRNQ